MFLYTELYQKKSFPQMAIENDFDLCEDYMSLGREISGESGPDIFVGRFRQILSVF